MPLVIVESPAKARTIKGFLGKTYTVLSSFGHVRDLPKSKLGIDPEHNFAQEYVTTPKAKKVISTLKKTAKEADSVILATDEDREGEAIAWHIAEALKLSPKDRRRIVFHEITREAIKEALKHPRDIDANLVDAQRARRVLDRIVGYKLSPLLWRKIARGLSAGRVQSVALRLVVEREREREAFKPEEYWSITGTFSKSDGEKCTANLTAIDQKALGKFGITTKKTAEETAARIRAANGWHVATINDKENKRQPYPPYMTATLQQDASQRLGFAPKQTMRLAQQLYEGIELPGRGHTGLITYMRTDSLNLAQRALSQAAGIITERFGQSYLHTRQYKTSAKGAQEAHEAIRPTDLTVDPDSLKNVLDARQHKLYKLIWSRTLASQMAPAVLKATSAAITDAARTFTFTARGQVVKFEGFLKVYSLAIKDELLPSLTPAETLTLAALKPDQHFTKPPARYSEAMLIKALKDNAIGRPSTYAPTIDNIIQRGYVEKDAEKRLLPTDLGCSVNDLLTKHFPDIVDIAFTAHMEEDLDDIAAGKKPWVPIIKNFYDPFVARIKEKETSINKKDFAEKATDKVCPDCGRPMVLKFGRFGQFYSCSGYPDCKHAEPVINSTNVKCPQCAKEGRAGQNQGELIERRTRKGKIFYGCSKYPKCTFALWDKPTGETCSTCGALMVQKGRRTFCSNKECPTRPKTNYPKYAARKKKKSKTAA